jgi:hypothetical protein|tara:strand:- start:4934 stop:5131 length:198 start_codon:yes stop_codon:yes gene_type:complete
MFKLEFSTENSAFDPETIDTELESILTHVAYQASRGETGRAIIDSNGNRVGKWSLESDNGSPRND